MPIILFGIIMILGDILKVKYSYEHKKKVNNQSDRWNTRDVVIEKEGLE